MRKVPFANGEFYHIYNRGTDKRTIFSDSFDQVRFLQSMLEFNAIDPIGSIYEHSFIKNKQDPSLGSETSKSVDDSEERLVNIVAYCLNPNHFHLILQQVSDKGIEKYMQRIGTGYTKYFNHKNERSGVLFQGVFQSVHIDSNEYLLHVSVYVNLNDRVHQLGSETSKSEMRGVSSWNEYVKSVSNQICKKEDVLGQFGLPGEYEVFAENTLIGFQQKKLLKNEKF